MAKLHTIGRFVTLVLLWWPSIPPPVPSRSSSLTEQIFSCVLTPVVCIVCVSILLRPSPLSIHLSPSSVLFHPCNDNSSIPSSSPRPLARHSLQLLLLPPRRTERPLISLKETDGVGWASAQRSNYWNSWKIRYADLAFGWVTHWLMSNRFNWFKQLSSISDNEYVPSWGNHVLVLLACSH